MNLHSYMKRCLSYKIHHQLDEGVVPEPRINNELQERSPHPYCYGRCRWVINSVKNSVLVPESRYESGVFR